MVSQLRFVLFLQNATVEQSSLDYFSFPLSNTVPSSFITLLLLRVLCQALQYSAWFCLLEDLAELADEPTGFGEVARGGCLFAWNFSVTRSTVLTEAERRTRPNATLHQ